MAHSLTAAVLVASNTTFFVLFGIFVVAFVVLCVITVTWAIRRDRSGRADWRQRQLQRHGGEADGADTDPSPPTPTP